MPAAATGAAGGDGEDTIWKACAYGKDALVRDLLAASPPAASTPDGDGYSPLQWAALNGRVSTVTLLVSAGADVAYRDPTGQTALHWAAVRGCVATGDALHAAGADAAAADARGYTPLHVAAQHGRAAFAGAAVARWKVDPDARDADGRSPLAWAAYKHAADVVRVLLALGADPLAADAEAATPLHWAALRGAAEAATLLLHAGGGGALSAADATGGTPARLARGRGHNALADRLDAAATARAAEAARARGRGFMGAARRFIASVELAPVTVAVIVGLVAVFHRRVVHGDGLPPPSPRVAAAGVLVPLLASVGLLLMLAVARSDPGVLPRAGRPASPRRATAARSKRRRAAARLHHRGTDDGGDTDDETPPPPLDATALTTPPLSAGHWDRLCVACRSVRPPRAKHCPSVGRCVAEFDHHCPWVAATVGGGNRPYFLLFLAAELCAAGLAAVAAVARLHGAAVAEAAAAAAAAATATAPSPPPLPSAAFSSAALWMGAFLVGDGFILLSVGALAATQAYQVSTALTTNEAVNAHRYAYLKGEDGAFANPYDRGCVKNWAHAMTRVRPGKDGGGGGATERELLLRAAARSSAV